MKYEEAMSQAEKTGTERRNKKRHVYERATWTIGGLCILAAVIWLPAGPLQTYAHRTTEEKAVAMAHDSFPSVQGRCGVGSSCIVNVPPYGNSPPLTVAQFYQPRFSGAGFQAVCVYSDNSKGIIGSAVQPCHDGPIVYVYLHDVSGHPNTVLYEQVR